MDPESKLSQVYTRNPALAWEDSTCTTIFGNLKVAALKETWIWWDFTGLKQYVSENILRSMDKKNDFQTEWNNILSRCSLDLMGLIITHEERLLNTFNVGMKTLKDSPKPFQSLEVYTLNEYLSKSLNKLEQDIMNTKR